MGRRWLWRGAFAVGIAIGFDVVASARHDDIVLATVAAFAAVACLGLVFDTSTTSGSAGWSSDPGEAARARDVDPGVTSYRRLIEDDLSSRQPDSSLARALLRLADQRIADEYGVTTATDPERAATLLGPDLFALRDLIRHHRPVRLSTQRIATLIDRIEQL